MLSKLTEVYAMTQYHRGHDQSEFGLRDVYINPTSVSMIRSEPNMKKYLSEGKLPAGIDGRMEFSRLSVSSVGQSSSIVVVGDPHMVQEKLKQTRRLLKG